MLLSIVIPAYNEEKRIPLMLGAYLDFFRNTNAEFIVVPNGCRDNTLKVVEEFKKRNQDRIVVVNIPEAIGKGGAVRRGFSIAKGDVIGFVDADGATEPAEFNRLIKVAKEHDGAIASRWKSGSEVIGRNFFRKMVSFGFIIFVKMIFWMPYFDTQCGAKIFKRSVVSALLPDLKVNNMAFDVEFLYKARRRGYDIVECPSRWVDKSSSAMLGSAWGIISGSVKMLITLLKIRFS
jgi:glycosyltransferase involved in cell wall biosynthesis